ncbi:heme-binding protein [uncultured Roseibium sp.]|uniref:GlcG/HbpS family heme-binding protein n=1 Tax=uncultured Roseibium sp. TaxID=1936171 RepID=UPI002628102C|nr:heme-binding protein [uncultured Roseibium sp.]
METTQTTQVLTHQGTLTLLTAAVAKAEEIGQPQCIVIVDASGEVLAEIRMTGAKFLSRKSALAKALTAASIGAATVNVPEEVRTLIGLATGGNVTGLPGGMPIVVNGVVLGGIGVGSGSGEQDIEVARAALAAIGAET